MLSIDVHAFDQVVTFLWQRSLYKRELDVFTQMKVSDDCIDDCHYEIVLRYPS